MSLKPWFAALAGALLTLSVPAAAKETLSMVQPHDPIFEASMWPIVNHKVTSDKVDVQVTYTSIQSVIQAAVTKQYDLVPMVTQALPRLVARGLDLKVISTNQRYQYKGGGSHLYVAATSPIRSVADLKGKTIGVTSLNSSGVTASRIVLSKAYKMNVALDGGDFKWVEMPLPVLPTALSSGRIDAAVLSNQQDYEALNNKKDFRVLVPEGMIEALGVAIPTTVVISYDEKLKARPEAFVEAARLLRQSAEYVRAHEDEVFGAIAKESGADVGYMKWYMDNYADIPYDLTQDDLKGMQVLWEESKKLGILKDAPKAQAIVWDRAPIK
jgi:NitT/TauT family transport system substrate-binding protein